MEAVRTVRASVAPLRTSFLAQMPWYCHPTQEAGRKERKPAGLPIKTLEGEVQFQQRAQQGAAVAAAAPLAVAGITIHDDLEEQLQVRLH